MQQQNETQWRASGLARWATTARPRLRDRLAAGRSGIMLIAASVAAVLIAASAVALTFADSRSAVVPSDAPSSSTGAEADTGSTGNCTPCVGSDSTSTPWWCVAPTLAPLGSVWNVPESVASVGVHVPANRCLGSAIGVGPYAPTPSFHVGVVPPPPVRFPRVHKEQRSLSAILCGARSSCTPHHRFASGRCGFGGCDCPPFPAQGSIGLPIFVGVGVSW